MVSPAKQIWKDFSSGKGGGVVSFIMEHEQFSYPEALRWLAKRYNIEIEEDKKQTDEQIAEAKNRENQYTITEFANKFFQEQLHQTEEGKNIGLSYFKERGFLDTTIEKFGLGYSPRQWDAFTSYAMKKGYKYEPLQAAGFTVGKPEKPVDRFRERVMFPIQSFSGRTLGFGGRILGNNKKTAKYLNSPENEIYHKSKILYGIFQAKQAILKKDECLLVEGYTDVISLHQSGIENVVSSSGTALTPDQIRLIKRLTQHLVLIYDGDTAGIKASFRGIDLILEQNLNVKIVLLPDGDDPDSFAKKHSEAELQTFFAENAVDFIRFKVNVLKEDVGEDPVKNAEMIQEIVKTISLIPQLIQRELYVRDAAKLLDIREEILFRELDLQLNQRVKEQNRKQRYNNQPTEQPPLEVVEKGEKPQVNFLAKIEEDLLQAMVKFGDQEIYMPIDLDKNEYYKSTVIQEIIYQLEEDDIVFSTPFYRDMYVEIKEGLDEDIFRVGNYFINHQNQELSKKAGDMLYDKYNLSDWEKQGVPIPKIIDNIQKQVQEMILNYKRVILLNMIQKEQSKLKLEEEDNVLTMNRIVELNKMKNQIDTLLNRSV